MTTHLGNEGQVKIATDVIAEVTGFSITENAVAVDDSSLGDAWDTHKVGSKSWTATIDCHWDETDTNGQLELTVGAAVSLLNFYVEGSATGAKYYSGDATVTQITRQSSRNQVVSASYQVQGNGALTFSTVS